MWRNRRRRGEYVSMWTMGLCLCVRLEKNCKNPNWTMNLLYRKKISVNRVQCDDMCLCVQEIHSMANWENQRKKKRTHIGTYVIHTAHAFNNTFICCYCFHSMCHCRLRLFGSVVCSPIERKQILRTFSLFDTTFVFFFFIHVWNIYTLCSIHYGHSQELLVTK